MNENHLREIAQGQAQRSVKDRSKTGYLSRVKTLSDVMFKNPGLRRTCLESEDEDEPTFYIGLAHKIRRLKLPMSKDAVMLLFAAISVDGSLPQKRKRSAVVDVDQGTVETTDSLHPSQRIATVSAQSYQNFKSSLKWFVQAHFPAWEKEGSTWSDEVDRAVQQQIHGYKKDVGEKKRIGVMEKKEGKSKYSKLGYITLCK